MTEPHRLAWGYGLATVADDDLILDTWFPEPQLGPLPEDAEIPAELAELAGRDARRKVRLEAVIVAVDLDEPVGGTSDAYLRLHLLSHLLARPNEQNLDGIFAHLPNVVFTSAGPVAADEYPALLPTLKRAGIQAYAVDKFPRLLDYVVPDRVRIADASRVRLGAHLSPGTVVMHEGFVNFNAGTLGASMVEGRISQGVIVGDGSDIGGGASVMGTLSGGGTHRVEVGARALLGANAGIGISLGDDSVVEAGLYVTAGTKITVVGERDENGQPITVKAASLSGVPNVLFRRNSVTGAVEVVQREGDGVALNQALHL